MLRSAFVVALTVLASVSAAADPPPPDNTPFPEKPKTEFGNLSFRALGPAISGRVDRVAGVSGNPGTFYAAFAQGGVWKSENGGRDWNPIFDDEPTNSIGSIAVAPSDPNVIYVGTGEANMRGNVAFGTGIFRSTDAGRTWQQVWKTHGQIGTMAVDPKNPDIAFAAVFGSPFGPSKDRGVYRTTDGGKHWQQVLFKDERTGASDVAFDPNNPRILFAGLWQALRQPWNFTSGGPGSGLYRSDDGGDTWKQYKPGEKGLPHGDWGKVGVRVAPSDSSRVYALIEAEEGGLFRSDDGGASWDRVNDDHVLRQRAWYYTCLTIDPTNADVVWFPQVNLIRTIDGGKTLQSVDGPHHGDHHDIWIDPADPRRVISSNDGGLDITVDAGATWFAPATPTPQFYNIDADDRLPYHVGGTIQDWGTASGPAYVLRSGDGTGPNLGDFYYSGGGEAGDFVYDRAAAGHIYAGEYSGYISHFQEDTGDVRNVSIYPHNDSGHGAEDARYRFQWTAPIATSPNDPTVLYHGANVLLRSTDRGTHWQAISPDLTRNDKSKQKWAGGPITGDNTGVEVYDTIFSIAESPVAAGQIWVGTDDGLVQLTRDGGRSWSNVTPSKLPAWATVEAIEPSHKDAGTAYVAVDARRINDTRPYLFRTHDSGKSWELLGKGLPTDEHLYVVREDPTDPNLLYVGSERGLYFSRNGGGDFQKLKLGLPAVNVADIEVKHDDLILGTRRGIWILDDITALRAFVPAVKNEAVHLFAPRPAHRFRTDYRWDAGRDGDADNAPMGLTITYWLKEKRKEPEPDKKAISEWRDGKNSADESDKTPSAEDASALKLEIFDSESHLVRTLSSVPKPNRYGKDDPDQPEAPAEPELTGDYGLNRVQWDLRYDGATRLENAKIDSGNPDLGPMALPGKYSLKLTIDGRSYSTTAEILPDPRMPVSPDELRQNVAFALQARDALNRLTTDIDAVRAIREQALGLKQRTSENPAAANLQAIAKTVLERCDALESRMHNPEANVVYDVLAGRKGGAKLYAQISPLFSDIQSSDYAPTQGQLDQMSENLAALKTVEDDLAALRNGDVARLDAEAASLRLPRVIVPAGDK